MSRHLKIILEKPAWEYVQSSNKRIFVGLKDCKWNVRDFKGDESNFGAWFDVSKYHSFGRA